MIEIVATSLITLTSVLLFGYWFRYTCMLILTAKTTREFADSLVKSGQLGFANVQSQLRMTDADLSGLKHTLDRDYVILKRMLEQTEHLSADSASIEQKMLQLNYKISSAWFEVSSRVWPTAARKTLDEMSMVVAHFASVMGERVAVSAAA